MTKHTFVNGVVFVDCHMCGAESEVPVTKEKYDQWQSGKHAQDVWPEMSLENRELLISGTCLECQKVLFAEPED